MLKDTFKWHACVEKVETTPCGGKVEVSLLGYSDYPFGGCISIGGSGEALAKEIAYCMNNGTRDNTDMDVNSLYPTHPENKEWNDNTDLYRLMFNSTYWAEGQRKPTDKLIIGGMAMHADRHGHAFTLCNSRPNELNVSLQNYIEDVIFNDPATIVKWKDGTKTVVKVQEGDEFDPMVGLAMCIAKKAMGNQGNYFEVFKKWCEPWYKEKRIQEFNEVIMDGSIGEIFENIRKSLSRGFKEGLKVKTQESPVLGKVINCKEDGGGFTLTLDEGHHCIYCKHCERRNDIYLCMNPIIAINEIKAPQFMSCPEWEKMPEPKNETDEK